MSCVVRKSFKCPICSKTFNRAEHAKRHETQHDGGRAHACDTCRKSFTRKDALLRHQAVHNGKPSLLETKSRACQACAKSKTKCSGLKPCTRCSRRNIICTFPHSGLSERQLQQGESIPSLQTNTNSQSTIVPNEITIATPVNISGVGPSAFMTDESNSQEQPTITHDSTSASLNEHITIQEEPSTDTVITSQFEDLNGFDIGCWTPSALSSINWLPIDLSSLPLDDHYMPSITLKQPTFLQPTLDTDIYGLEDHVSKGLEPAVIQRSGVQPQQGVELTQQTGDYYINSDTTRLTRTKRRKIITHQDGLNLQVAHTFDFDFSSLLPIHGHRTLIVTDKVHGTLKESFQSTCLTCAPLAQPFTSIAFPSKDHFGMLLDLYFNNVHQTLPCIHPSTFQNKFKTPTPNIQLLIIAMALLGSCFIDTPWAIQVTSSMLEFGRRLLTRLNMLNDDTTIDTNLAQAQLLLMIGAKTTLANKRTKWTEHIMCDLRAFCLSCAQQFRGESAPTDVAAEADWFQVIQKQEKLRTTYIVWQIDLLSYAQGDNERLHLPLSIIIELPLPGDSIWTTCSPVSWKSGPEQTPHITLFKALQCLYMEKRLPVGLSDFDHILLLYAVIHRTWDVQHNVSQPFSNMEPNAGYKADSSHSQTSQWPPAVPHFTCWRNSACDCFDILHWQANAAIGNAKGLEPPKVLHLHLARLLILSPLSSILLLSPADDVLSRTTSKLRAHQKDEAHRAVFRWATSDQYKARLSAIHAGVIFWHIRRYSTNAFYEPFAVLAATVTLWALSVFSRKRSMSANNEPSPVNHPCNIILIDRPTDDELVQQFVRSGDDMIVHMSVIRNLWDRDAPAKVLGEGKKLLSSLGAWSAETKHAIEAIENLLKYEY